MMPFQNGAPRRRNGWAKRVWPIAFLNPINSRNREPPAMMMLLHDTYHTEAQDEHHRAYGDRSAVSFMPFGTEGTQRT